MVRAPLTELVEDGEEILIFIIAHAGNCEPVFDNSTSLINILQILLITRAGGRPFCRVWPPIQTQTFPPDLH